MLILISPAKKLLTEIQPFPGKTTEPQLMPHTQKLIKIMKSKTVKDIAKLMDLSANLAELNYERYQHFQSENHLAPTAYPAILLFQGDVYQGLQAKTWDTDELNYSQNHLGILSGLYGLLKPLDLIQPYRLEMGVHLATPRGTNLYDFWGELITYKVNEQLSTHENPILINLASTEYFKVIHADKLKYKMITINFYEHKNNQIKMIGIYSKKARGMMSAYLIKNQIKDVDGIKDFSQDGYTFNEETSTSQHLDFIRQY
jgi:cytoplasmic iron level regulating protein YaaA (DUF328/UPF0246 family)